MMRCGLRSWRESPAAEHAPQTLRLRPVETTKTAVSLTVISSLVIGYACPQADHRCTFMRINRSIDTLAYLNMYRCRRSSTEARRWVELTVRDLATCPSSTSQEVLRPWRNKHHPSKAGRREDGVRGDGPRSAT